MHDTGSITVDEVHGLLSTMTARGHRFTSISEGLVMPGRIPRRACLP
jgi:hypothetical protein